MAVAADSFGAEKARIIRGLERELAARGDGRADAALGAERNAELARERARLLSELGRARDETARYRQLVIDTENNAPPPILAAGAGPDDLKLIVGIGPVLERMLHIMGITHYRQIARWTARDAAEFDARLPEFPGRIERDQWIVQARALHQSKYGDALAPAANRR